MIYLILVASVLICFAIWLGCALSAIVCHLVLAWNDSFGKQARALKRQYKADLKASRIAHHAKIKRTWQDSSDAF